MTTKISIIIIVKNDRGIANTLAALETQKRTVPTETIVVDSSDIFLLEDIRNKFPGVQWHHFTPKIKNKSSIPEQRNFGIQHAQGEIIVFIDANCIPADNWLVNLTEPILSGKETMTAGSVSAANPKTQVNFTPLDIKTSYLSSSPTINLAFVKKLWDKIGGFDETFLYGSDIDFTWRWVDAGNKIFFVQQASITHDWGNIDEELKRIFKYGKARADLLMKHPQRAREQLFGEAILVLIYSGWLLGLPLTYFFPWYPLTILLIVLKNIRSKPFKTVTMNLIFTIGFLKRFLTVKFSHVK